MAGTRGAYIKGMKAKRAKDAAAHSAAEEAAKMCLPPKALVKPTAPIIEKPAKAAPAIDMENKPTYHRRGRGHGKFGR